MKINRLTVLVTILIIVSVGTNIIAMQKGDLFTWPTEDPYYYSDMFGDSVLMYRPPGTEALKVLDMTDAVIVVTNFGAPLNCLSLSIQTKEGIMRGDCLEHVIIEPTVNE